MTSDLRIVQKKHFGLERIKGVPKDFMDDLSWLMGETSLGLCDIAVVEHKQPEQMALESERRLD